MSIGTKITGEFNDDGIIDTVKVIQTGKEIIDGQKANSFELKISGDTTRLMKITCSCKNILLINEGNIDKSPGDEISVVSTGIEAPIVDMYTYTVVGKKTKMIIGPSMLGTTKTISKEKLQNFLIKNEKGVFQKSYENGLIIEKNGNAKGKLVWKRIDFK